MVDGYRALGEELLGASSTAGSTRCAIYVGTARLLPRRHRAPCATRLPDDPARRRRAGRVGGAVRPGPAGTHRIEGGGVGFVPPQLSLDDGRRGRHRLDGRRVRDGPPGRPRRGGLVGTVDRRQPHRRPGRSRAGSARARGSPPIQVDSGLKYLGRRALPPERRDAGGLPARSRCRRTAAARGPARRDVHRVLAASSTCTPRSRRRPGRSTARSSGCRCSSSSRSASGAATARCRARRSGSPPIAGVFFAGDLMFWHHAIEAVGAGLGDRPRQPPGHHRRVLRVARCSGSGRRGRRCWRCRSCSSGSS